MYIGLVVSRIVIRFVLLFKKIKVYRKLPTFSHFSELDLSNKYKENSERLSWSLEEGFQRLANNSLEHYPYRTMGGGIRAGLSMKLRNVKIDFDSTCRSVFDGFKVSL